MDESAYEEIAVINRTVVFVQESLVTILPQLGKSVARWLAFSCCLLQ
jgi:hypothetical protein